MVLCNQAGLFQLNVQQFARFGRWSGSEKGTWRLVLLFFLGAALLGAFIPGVLYVETESNIDELYVHQNDRLKSERGLFEDFFGGLARLEATLHTSATGNTAQKNSLESIEAAITPVFKHDETHFCPSFDDTTTTAPTECSQAPYNTSALYCTCTTVAASPDEVTILWPGVFSNGTSGMIELTQVDVCETPAPPLGLQKQPVVSLFATETAMYSSATYIGARDATLASLTTGLANDTIYQTAESTAVGACETAFETVEDGRAGASLRSDFVSATLACSVTVVAQVLGPSYSLASNAAFDSPALQAMWHSFATDPSATSSSLAAVYNSVSADGLSNDAADTVLVNNATVVEGTTAVATSVLRGASVSQFTFVTSGRTLSFGYAEVASCVADFVAANDVIEDIFTAVMTATETESLASGELEQINTKYSLSFPGYADTGIDAIEFQMRQSADPPRDPVRQLTAILAFIGNDTTVYVNVSDAIEQRIINSNLNSVNVRCDLSGESQKNASLSEFDDNGLEAARTTAVAIYGSSGNVTTLEDSDNFSAIQDAYRDNGGTLSDSFEAARLVVEAITVMVELAEEILGGVITGIVSQRSAEVFLDQLDVATVNFTLRPLPRTWGVDRFPCSRVTPLDAFREGGFDYPYAMKQAEQIGAFVYTFLTASFFEAPRVQANCEQLSFINPLKQALYLSTFNNAIGDVTSYQADNFPSFDAAEAAFSAAKTGGATDTDAATAAVVAYFGNGGEYRTAENPTTAATPTAAFQSALGTAVATAVKASDSASTSFASAVELFFALGYWHRQSYLDYANDAEVLSVIDRAIKDTSDTTITFADCFRHNTKADLTGRDVPACFLTFSGTKSPHQLVVGGLTYGSTLDFAGKASLSRVDSMRTVLINFNEGHPAFADSIAETLGRTLSISEREEVQRAFEQAIIDHYAPLYAKSSSSSFGSGGAFAEESLLMNVERSSSDALAALSEFDQNLLIGAGVLMLIYAAFTVLNMHSSVYTHVGLMIWGVVCILLATAASFGLSGYAGIPLTPIATSVVPFLAIGVGVDDLFVLTQTYAREVVKGKSVKGTVTAVLGEAGPSITFTSLINLTAFLIAAATPIQVVRLFCFQMAISVFFNYAAIMTLIVAALVLDCKRTLSDRADCGVKLCHKEEESTEPGPVARVCATSYPSFLMNNFVRAFVLVFFTAWFGVSIWSAFYQRETGLRLSDVTNEGSYQNDFATLLEDDFRMFSSYIITRSRDFPNAQQQILDTLPALQSSASVSDVPDIRELYWLTDLLKFANASAPTTPLPVAEFYDTFASWIGTTGIKFSQDLYCIDTNDNNARVPCGNMYNPVTRSRVAGIELLATRGLYYLQNLAETDDFLDAIRSNRALVDAANDDYANGANDPSYTSFTISYVHLFWDQYLHSDYDLYFVVGMCLVGVFVVTLIFTFNLGMAVILCGIILMVVIELVGLMPIWGVKMNAFSLVNVCMAVGMAVEFTAHLAHEFIAQQGSSRRQRTFQAVSFMGAAMLHGAISSFLSTCFIAGSDADFVVDVFFGMFFAIVVIASLNGLVFLPVLLSFIGPAPVSVDDYLEDTGDDVVRPGPGSGAKRVSSVSGGNDFSFSSNKVGPATVASAETSLR